MNIYLNGACNTGKAEVARRLAEEVPGMQVCLNPSEMIFEPLFGHKLNRIFRGRLWEGHIDKAYTGTMQYLDMLKGEEGKTTVFNEGPVLFLSHLLFFGSLALLKDDQRESIISKCVELIGQGEHYIIQRWADKSLFDRVNVSIQMLLGCNRTNVFVLTPAVDYESTITHVLTQIRRGRLSLEEDILARIAREEKEAMDRTVETLKTIDRIHTETMEWEQQEYQKLENTRREVEEEMARRREETERMIATEMETLESIRKEAEENGNLVDA